FILWNIVHRFAPADSNISPFRFTVFAEVTNVLELMNRYIHGFVAIPVILSCRDRGFFELLQQNQSMPIETIIGELNANSGHFSVAMRMMESLDWIKRNDTNEYFLTDESKAASEIPSDILELFHFPITDYIRTGAQAEQICKYFDRSRQ